MTTYTEGQHKGEFIVALVDDGDIAVETGTYASGASVIKDGTVLKDNGSGSLVAATGSVNSAGSSDETIMGIAYGDIDVTGGAVSGPYVARLAVVNTDLIITSGDKAALVAALAALFIIVR